MPSGSGDGAVRGAAAELVTKHSLRACEDCRRVGQRTFHRRHRWWGEGTVLLPGAHPGRRSKTGPASFSAYSTGQASPRPPEDPPSSGEEQSWSLFVKNEDSEVQRGKTSHTASCSYLLR